MKTNTEILEKLLDYGDLNNMPLDFLIDFLKKHPSISFEEAIEFIFSHMKHEDENVNN